MDNENIIIVNSNITSKSNRFNFVPEEGDEFVFCSGEDTAYIEFYGLMKLVQPNIKESFLTDFFKLKEIHGTLCEPIYVADKKYGTFGCRFNVGETRVKGVFYLYEME